MTHIVEVEVPDPPMLGTERKPYSVAEHIDAIQAAFAAARDRECDRVIAEAQARIDARKKSLDGTPEIDEHEARMTTQGEGR